MEKISVGIIGFGTGGAGVAQCLLQNGALIGARTGVEPVLARIADLDITSDRGVSVPDGVLTTNVGEVLDNPEIDVVVELVGGTTVAREFILKALGLGKPVVTANKALLAHHGDEIFEAAENSSADVFYEASVAGGIPIIKAVRESLVGNRIHEIVGILNGTCNYILTRMEREELPFDQILQQAQDQGFAEADPALDIDGIDAAHKTTILASLAYGEWFGMNRLYVEGIRGISLQDLAYAAKLGYRIKLLAIIKQADNNVQMRVHPTLVPADSILGSVSGVFNAVWVKGDTVGENLYYGRGAGRQATASAVVSDIVDVGRNIVSGARRRVAAFQAHAGYSKLLPMTDVETRYYLRLQVEDRPGVMALVADVLGRAGISLASVSQEEGGGESVPVVFVTHNAREYSMQKALSEIRNLEPVMEEPVVYRIEDLM